MSSLLSIDDIQVSYGNIKALKGVSIDAQEGQIVCLIGANGAGKSTLLRSIVGLEPLVSGQISYSDSVIAQGHGEHHRGHANCLPTEQICSLGIALVPEGRRVFADMTVEENLDMGAFLVKDKSEILKRKSEMYDFFPILGQRRKQKTRSLSGGEQQMMAIARALMSSPHLLLLDEPGLGLAPLVVQDIFSKISIINKENKVTVFLVEQNARMALRAADDGYVMENGLIVLSDKASALLANPKVKSAYLGQ
ncbi:MAG: ABC transporter ATP-binding protein [Sphaerochaetaceae bacterium]|nr:ABC transporter ATP-binding protein [Sphaerochaetaceae bacterium]MDD3163080.1 ABC transporter ATP-binding protein [Sphaerochaetaceae bacterium]MDD4007407.1 ABC transporter ATP-binding protein [Sphaerochaetaceae bacterium]MDD4396473.1 ABC transporter ATP-binding protein [Sphaerochaetaceae bacterium]